MAKSTGQKMKLLYIRQLLEEESSEEHPVSTQRVIEYLDSKGIGAERKSIYDDMEKLREFGCDVLVNSSRNGGGYYLGSREFEMPELKLLVDAVQSSRFITQKKSWELIKKLEAKAGKYDAGKLQRQVFVVGRVKTENENVYYSIDAIHTAIQENRQIRFQYMDWNSRLELVPRRDPDKTVSPWALVWVSENYYLAAYDEHAGLIKHYRVDKMNHVEVLSKKRLGKECYEKLDPASYTNQTFGMFGGKTETVTLSFPEKLIGVVVDRFGKEISLRQMEDGSIRVRVRVAVSGQFFGWLAGIGNEIRLIGPENIKQDYKNWLTGILKEMSE